MEGLIQLECIQPGGGTYLVDQGRPGLRHLGIPRGGAADGRAAGRARQLLELPAEAPLLEISLSGGQWLLSGKGQFVITGADMDWRINGRPIELYTTIDFDGDYMIDGSAASKGYRSYLGVKGNWKVERKLNSVSPGLPEIKPIRSGWCVSIQAEKEAPYTSDLDIYQHCPALPHLIKVQPGPEWTMLAEQQQQRLLNAKYTVATNSNRQGLRLLADEESDSYQLPNLISSPVLPGTVQLTPAGPIVLLQDAQTIGGFPRILLLQASELDVLGQLKPGDNVRFSLN